MSIPTALKLVLVGVTIAFAGETTSRAADRPVGRLHRIDIKAEHPRAYHPQMGDLMQCYLDFPVVPERIVEDFEVTIEGKAVALVGVINTSLPKIVGSGQISVYFVPRQAGVAQVTILPIIPGQTPSPVEINFLVTIPNE